MKDEWIITPSGSFLERKRSELGLGEGSDGDQLVLAPYYPPDRKIEFSDAPLGDAFSYVGSGLATHSVRREVGTTARKAVGFAATDLMIFSAIDWHGECFAVLESHGWLGRNGRLSGAMVSRVASIYGEAEIELAKEQYGENWESYVGELAAVHFAKPLSRLWYAANMFSLHYARQDDLRLGFLWAEYRIRLRHERDAIRGKKNAAGAAASGAARARKFDELRRQVVERMLTYVRNGKSVANAASLTFKGGLGTSAEANRKLWMRHYRD